MPQQCLVCHHPQRLDAEQALLSGSTQRAVALALGVSRQSVQRHVASGHVNEVLRRNAVAVEQVAAADIAGSVITLAERALALLTRAENDDDRGTQVAAIREVRGILGLLSAVRIDQEKEAKQLDAGRDEPDLDLDAALRLRLLGHLDTDDAQSRPADHVNGTPRNGPMRELLPPQ